MSLEIIGKTIGGKTVVGIRNYSRFFEDNLPTSESNTSFTNEYWSFTGSAGSYSDYYFYSSKDNYVRIDARGGTSGTSGTGTARLLTTKDMRNFKKFYFSGGDVNTVHRYAYSTAYGRMYFGIYKDGVRDELQTDEIAKSDYNDDYGGSEPRAWFIKGEMTDEGLVLTYGGFNRDTAETKTITPDGKIQLFWEVQAVYSDPSPIISVYNCIVE